MRFISAQFRIVTPMFLGGADSGEEKDPASTGIRPASLKGALAFWWRALNYGIVRAGCSNEGEALAEMRRREIALFGGPGGQSGFSLQVRHAALEKPLTVGTILKDGNNVVGEGSRYLGFGAVNAFHISADPQVPRKEKMAGELERNCVPRGTFELRILPRPTLDEDRRKELLDAIRIFGLLGGLGARVRRGYGSLALMALHDKGEAVSLPTTRQAYIAALKKLISSPRGIAGREFPVSAFAPDSRIYVGTVSYQTALAAHDALGAGLKRYRAWRLPAGQQRNFTGDHHWAKDRGTPAEPESNPPQRIAFGLPQVYNKQTDVRPANKFERRASPLMFHVHPVESEFVGVTIYLPTQFLPERKVTTRRAGSTLDIAYDFDTAGRPVIEAFLDGKANARVTTVHGAPFLDGERIL